jgi:hypothetical protein
MEMGGKQAKSEGVVMVVDCFPLWDQVKVSPKTGLASGWTDTEKHFKLRDFSLFVVSLLVLRLVSASQSQ